MEVLSTGVTDGPDFEIVGFVYEQSPLNRFVLARHADFVGPDGSINAG